MYVSFNPSVNYFDRSDKTSFQGAKSRKFLEQVLKAKVFKNVNATFDDMVAAYNELGYDVVLKRGSHAIIRIDDNLNLPLVIPHGKKYVHPNDVRRLQYIINKDFERAARI